jgi:hypothetical protein
MSPENAPQQANLEGEVFGITPRVIVDNKEMFTDFFGDNRAWYKQLLLGGSTFSRTSLDITEMLADDTNPEVQMPKEQLPLDPDRITTARAASIASFFEVYPAALVDFLEYSKWYTENTVKDEPTS